MTTTTETKAQAQAIAGHLVEQRLAACVQIVGPIASTYRWKDEVVSSEEFMCIVKTRTELAGEVETAIRSLHSYDNPEIVLTPIVGGSAEYLSWVVSETVRT